MRNWCRLTCARGMLVFLALLLGGCATTAPSGQGQPATPTPTLAPSPTLTPTPTCATALPGSGPITLPAAFPNPVVLPPNTVGTPPAQTVTSAGLFAVYELDLCAANTSVAGVTSFFASNLPAVPHHWVAATTFPYDGGLLQACGAAQCWDQPQGPPFEFLAFDQLTDKGNGLVTFHLRYAVTPDPPSCNANFDNSPEQGFFYFLPGYTPPLPLPPITRIAPDSGAGVTGMDLCSPGTAASVSAFMLKELPATGWTAANDPRCAFQQCWTNGGLAISWTDAGDNTDWHIAWHH